MQQNTSPIFSVICLFFCIPGWATNSAGLIQNAGSSYIFVFTDTVNTADISNQAKTFVNQQGGLLRHTFVSTFKGFSAELSEPAAAAIVAANPNIQYYFPNGFVKAGTQQNVPSNNKSRSVQQIIPWGLQRIGGKGDGTNKHVWVLDTGVDLDNTDLNVSRESGKNCVVKGKDTFNDVNGHGTSIAGIIAAIDNEQAMLGVAPGATVHPVRILHNSLWGQFDEILCGIEHVVNLFASVDANPENHVVNMSLYAIVEGQEEGVARMENLIQNTVENFHLRFAVCAGNESDEAGNYSPARMTDSRIHTVTAIDQNDELYSHANYGVAVNWAAPGVNITSLKPGGGLATWSGCSFATAYVSGIILLKDSPVADNFVDNIPIATINGETQ